MLKQIMMMPSESSSKSPTSGMQQDMFYFWNRGNCHYKAMEGKSENIQKKMILGWHSGNKEKEAEISSNCY